MKSKWKVTSNSIGGRIMYAVFRIRDAGQPEHSGNREYAGGYTERRDEAQDLADKLNAEEAQNE